MEKSYHCACGVSFPVTRNGNEDSVTCPGCQKKYMLRAKARPRETGSISIPVPVERRPSPPLRKKTRRTERPLARKGTKAVDNTGEFEFTLALLGYLFCWLVSPFAWQKAKKKQKELLAANLPVPGLLIAGKVLGLVGSITLGLFVSFTLFWLFLGLIGLVL